MPIIGVTGDSELTMSNAGLTIAGRFLVDAGLIGDVSGVPLAEEQMRGRPGWDEYARRMPPEMKRCANACHSSALICRLQRR